MTSLFHLAGVADAALAWLVVVQTTLTAAWMAWQSVALLCSEVVTVAALLWSINFIATAIRWTYRAGFVVGSAWYRFGLPIVIWAADQLSLLWSLIDWRFVGVVVVDCLKVAASLLKVIAAALITASQRAASAASLLQDAHERWLWSAWSASWSEYKITESNGPEPAGAGAAALRPVTPFISPLFDMATQLESCMTANELREMTGSRRRCSKHQLIGGWIAA